MNALARWKIVLAPIATFAIRQKSRRLASFIFALQNRSMRVDGAGR